jgi:exopolyphosphatase / guanosine-5'-triphosphate,3'-diphosphate pyrophosphatase
MRVAAVDCGTNSARLLIADVDPAAGTLVDVDRLTRIVRLGEGVDATGVIAPAALARALQVSQEYAELVARRGATRVRFVATSAARDARNVADFVAAVRGAFGIDPEVIGGTEEARLSFVGAVRGLPGVHRPHYLVVDLGGGSTEFVRGAGGVEAAVSVDVGSVRITERHLRTDPPTAAEVAAGRRDVAVALDRADAVVDLGGAATLVGVAGSVTTITAHALRLPRYDSSAVHGASLSVDRVRAACADLLAAGRERRAALPYLPAGRADVIGAGALIWGSVVEVVARRSGIARVLASEHDILDGIAWALAESAGYAGPAG